MKVLVVGSGGREHALVWKIRQSSQVKQIFCAPGNAGIKRLAECVNISATDVDALVSFAKKEKVDRSILITSSKSFMVEFSSAIRPEREVTTWGSVFSSLNLRINFFAVDIYDSICGVGRPEKTLYSAIISFFVMASAFTLSRSSARTGLMFSRISPATIR